MRRHAGKHARAVEPALAGGDPIQAFPIRFAAVATAPVLLDSGPAGAAIQASAAVPGVNVPVRYESGHLIDGGISGLVPVRSAVAQPRDSKLRACDPVSLKVRGISHGEHVVSRAIVQQRKIKRPV